MSLLLRLSFKSILNRRLTTGLTVLTIAISVCLLLGIEKIRNGAKSSFERTVSGTDLIVGARSGNINLLLYAVFRMGNATNNVSWKTYETFSAHPAVKWTVPISLGDSHHGYRVVGTNKDFFEFVKFGGGRALEFKEGNRFSGVFDTVIGSEVAKKLNYRVGTSITLAHGTGAISFQEHANKPFMVVGVLKPTGTPIDRSIHVSLEAIEAIHVDWADGAPPMEGQALSPEETLKKDLNPKQITAFFIGLKSKVAVFRLQREINEYPEEPMSAILPGASLQELWQILSVAETSLTVVSSLVFVCSLLAMLLALMTTLNERRREMSILRSVGVKASFIFSILILESLSLAFLGIVLGIMILTVLLIIIQPILEAQLGLNVSLFDFSMFDLMYLGFVFVGAFLVGLLPAWKAYRNSVADGLVVRI